MNSEVKKFLDISTKISIKSRQNSAFTLAEVLITLAVIGIVAAMAIPSLQNNINEKELRTKWRKAYSTMANATNLIINENGGTMKGSFSSFADIVNLYSNKLNVITKCFGNADEKCWYDLDAPITYYDGTYNVNWSTMGASSYGFALSDGTFIIIHGDTNITTPECSGTSVGSENDHICIYFYVDVNGMKKPNKFGKDIYTIFAHEDGIKPFDSNDPSYDCKKTARGISCSSNWLYSDELE